MTHELRPHRKQFVVNRIDRPPISWYQTSSLFGPWFLHHCPELDLTETDSGTIAGHVFGADPLPTPSHRPSGRWTMLGDQIFGDSSGLQGIFYSGLGTPRSVVSSSAAILALANPELSRTALRLHGARPNWMPSPMTSFKGVFRLLPDEALSLTAESVTLDSCDHPLRQRPEAVSVEERATIVLDQLTSSIRAASRRGHLCIALTAGYDSRTILAAALQAGVEFTTYTQDVGEGHHDLVAARALSKQVGVQHHHLHEGQRTQRRIAEFDLHTAWASRDADRGFIGKGLFDHFGPEDVLLRGGCFELGSGNYHHFFGPDVLDDPVGALDTISKRFRIPPVTWAQMRDGYELWLQRRYAHPYALATRDAFFLDQRLGGWLSSSELGLDLVSPTSLHPANDGAVLRALVGDSSASRPQGREIQSTAIGIVDSELLQHPFNSYQPARFDRPKVLLRKAYQVAAGEISTSLAVAGRSRR